MKLKATYKIREEWWSRVFASPIAHYLLCVIGDWKFITPNRLTMSSLLLTIGVALLILKGTSAEMRLAAVLLQVAYIFDCMDGQLARYRNAASDLGAFLDKSLDYVKFSIIVFAITMNAYSQDPTSMTLVLGFLCLFLTCFLPYLKGMVNADFGSFYWLWTIGRPSHTSIVIFLSLKTNNFDEILDMRLERAIIYPLKKYWAKWQPLTRPHFKNCKSMLL